MRTRKLQHSTVERNKRIVKVVRVTKQITQCAPVYVSFGVAVRNLRTKAGMTQEDLAKLIGLSRASIANIECGRQQVLLGDIYEYAEAFGVSPRSIFNALEN
jgi:DNA-binding XRE family transcriptional regulator